MSQNYHFSNFKISELVLFYIEAEEDIPVPKREFDDLNLRHSELQEDYVNLWQELDTLWAENVKLKEELQKSKFSYTTVKCNMVQLLFLTGLTSVVFEWLLTKITGSVEIICKKLTVEDHLLVILMKWRLGLSNTDLAYRFKVSKTTISNILRSWVPVMALVLKPLIKWPSKGAMLKNMPKIFERNFRRRRCIIDCTEMFIARPSNRTSRA